jgi:hypothetical protein
MKNFRTICKQWLTASDWTTPKTSKTPRIQHYNCQTVWKGIKHSGCNPRGRPITREQAVQENMHNFEHTLQCRRDFIFCGKCLAPLDRTSVGTLQRRPRLAGGASLPEESLSESLSSDSSSDGSSAARSEVVMPRRNWKCDIGEAEVNLCKSHAFTLAIIRQLVYKGNHHFFPLHET